MLKSIIKVKENINIGQYFQLIAFLKAKAKFYKAVKAKAFEEDEVLEFLVEASDHVWLDVKVVCIFGVCGALRCSELAKLTIVDIDDHGNMYLVWVKDTKTKYDRSFTINAPFNEAEMYGTSDWDSKVGEDVSSYRYILKSAECGSIYRNRGRFPSNSRVSTVVIVEKKKIETVTSMSVDTATSLDTAKSGNVEPAALEPPNQTGVIISSSIPGTSAAWSSLSAVSSSGLITKSVLSKWNSRVSSVGIAKKRKIETVTSMTVDTASSSNVDAAPPEPEFDEIYNFIAPTAGTAIKKRKIETVTSKNLVSIPIDQISSMPHNQSSDMFRIEPTPGEVIEKKKIETVASMTVDSAFVELPSAPSSLNCGMFRGIGRNIGIGSGALKKCVIEKTASICIESRITPPSTSSIEADKKRNVEIPSRHSNVGNLCRIEEAASVCFNPVILLPTTASVAGINKQNTAEPPSRNRSHIRNDVGASQGYAESPDDTIDDYDSMLMELSFGTTVSQGFVQMGGDSVAFKLNNDYGDNVSLWIGSNFGALLSNPEHIKIITPSFHFKALDEHVKIFDRYSFVFVDILSKFKTTDKVELSPLIRHYTLDVVCKAAMGIEVNAQRRPNSEYVKAVRTVSQIMVARLISGINCSDTIFRFSPLYKQQTNGLKVIHAFTDRVIQERRQKLLAQRNKSSNSVDMATRSNSVDMPTSKTFLDILLEGNVDGKPLSNSDIREEVDTFMLEGHDTAKSGISFCFYSLARYPEIQQKCFGEIRNILGDDRSKVVSCDELNNLRYLDLVIKETLRLYPSLPLLGRLLCEELAIGKYTYPKGTNIGFSPFLLGRDPKLFENPLEFRPERFLEDTTTEKFTFSYLPFSAGPRNCVGQKYAVLEIKAVVSKVLRHFEISLADDSKSDPVLIGEVILSTKNPINYHLKPRIY
ncbi:hypothetical protein HA402_016215 [Bradysia odoriphaga]|nr:hypothetical protein HA402_016215 [Bradysia odoriphaga]